MPRPCLESVAESSDMSSEAAQFNGRTYIHSLAYTCSEFCNDPQGVAEYNLGKRYSPSPRWSASTTE